MPAYSTLAAFNSTQNSMRLTNKTIFRCHANIKTAVGFHHSANAWRWNRCCSGFSESVSTRERFLRKCSTDSSHRYLKVLRCTKHTHSSISRKSREISLYQLHRSRTIGLETMPCYSCKWRNCRRNHINKHQIICGWSPTDSRDSLNPKIPSLPAHQLTLLPNLFKNTSACFLRVQ